MGDDRRAPFWTFRLCAILPPHVASWASHRSGSWWRYLTERGLYGDYILASYSVSELEEAAAFMVSERDELFAYSGLDLLISRYVIRAHDHTPLESPQEMFLGIALHLAINEEPTQRLAWVKRFYDMLSKLEVTMATPTLSNARKPDHQLSSCFIDTVPDSLVGIYRSIDNFAQVSKYGGGMGMYLGKVRATAGPSAASRALRRRDSLDSRDQ